MVARFPGHEEIRGCIVVKEKHELMILPPISGGCSEFCSSCIAIVSEGLTSLLALLASLTSAGVDQERKVYIVYMGSLPRNQLYTASSHHVSLLQKVVGQSFQENLMVRSYNRSFNGFVATLTRSEVEELSGMENVVSVFPNRKYDLLTTRSWDFLGLAETARRNLQLESDIIIGVIDSGIWPELPSFSDEGFGTPPKKWKGVCKGGINFTCNNKLIGARYYGSAKSARDEDGHGSHTASTAAGVAIKNISFYGIAQGTVRGGVPSARIAAYNACGSCDSASVLAAFDDAIADGVDILSVSLGFSDVLPLDQDAIAIGAFHGMAKGILTVNAAGNNYNVKYGSIASVAPWMISVAASSMDRRIIAKAVLGNGRTLVGLTVNSFSLNGTNFPLVNALSSSTEFNGKIAVGLDASDVSYTLNEGAIGIIYQNDEDDTNNFEVVPFPGVVVSNADYVAAISYLNTTKVPVGTILPSEAVEDPSAPIVASFSSCGPNPILQEIMKPDVSAPGVDVLAGYSPIAPVSSYPNPADKRKVTYNIMTGTSMACPHVAGIAAYIKSFHPDWSPSAIQSAIMTTATPMSATAHLLGEFAYGSGLVNPVTAIHPGLVYEALEEDYLKLLCRVGFDEKKLRAITGDGRNCPKRSEQDLVLDFNYPSLTARVAENKPFVLRFSRVVTNVGQSNSVYKATVSAAQKFIVKVEPQVLSFNALKEKKSFNVTVTGRGFAKNLFESTTLVWFNGLHSVRTPIIVNTIQPGLLIPPLIDNVDG